MMLGLGLLLSALVLGGERVRVTKRTDEKGERENVFFLLYITRGEEILGKRGFASCVCCGCFENV
jgi:hypothetical protein